LVIGHSSLVICQSGCSEQPHFLLFRTLIDLVGLSQRDPPKESLGPSGSAASLAAGVTSEDETILRQPTFSLNRYVLRLALRTTSCFVFSPLQKALLAGGRVSTILHGNKKKSRALQARLLLSTIGTHAGQLSPGVQHRASSRSSESPAENSRIYPRCRYKSSRPGSERPPSSGRTKPYPFPEISRR
jgi:hypothetical protein